MKKVLICRDKFPRPKCDVDYAQTSLVLSVTKENVNGRLLPVSSYVTDDPRKRYDGLKVSDFSLENLLELGTTLNPVSINASTLLMADRLQRLNAVSNSFVSSNVSPKKSS